MTLYTPVHMEMNISPLDITAFGEEQKIQKSLHFVGNVSTREAAKRIVDQFFDELEKL